MFAVIKAGGKQYKVSQGDVITIEKVEAEVGSDLELGPVLMTGGEGKEPEVGAPHLDGKKVTGKVLAHKKDKKIITLKHLRRKNARKVIGHRQELTTVEITSIG